MKTFLVAAVVLLLGSCVLNAQDETTDEWEQGMDRCKLAGFLLAWETENDNYRTWGKLNRKEIYFWIRVPRKNKKFVNLLVVAGGLSARKLKLGNAGLKIYIEGFHGRRMFPHGQKLTVIVARDLRPWGPGMGKK